MLHLALGRLPLVISQKRSVMPAVLLLAALLLTPLLGCDQPRRYSRSSGYYGDEYSDRQRDLASDQRTRHEEEEQRHLDEERRQDRERSYDGSRSWWPFWR
jgi:hypothetical protein